LFVKSDLSLDSEGHKNENKLGCHFLNVIFPVKIIGNPRWSP